MMTAAIKGPTGRPLTAREVRMLAAAAAVDTRTVRGYLAGDYVWPLFDLSATYIRIDRALRYLGRPDLLRLRPHIPCS